MEALKRTVLYDAHVALGATMVDFGGWDMPIQYPSGIVEEHLWTRRECSLFDVSHMGRVEISGPDALPYLQHVLTSNVAALTLNQAQYCIIPTETGGAVDDAYVYRFEADSYFLVINAANIDKDLAHLRAQAEGYDVVLDHVSHKTASIAVQGPRSCELLKILLGGKEPTEKAVRNALSSQTMEGKPVRIAYTGYAGEPIAYELFTRAEDAVYFWNRLLELGAKAAGLGARDTLRLEAALPLYGHELGVDHYGNEISIFTLAPARFAVSFAPEKGDFIGRKALESQAAAVAEFKEKDFSHLEAQPYRVRPIALLGRGVLRAGFPIYRGGQEVGYVTSGTMVPYWDGDKKARRSIGLAYIRSDIVTGDHVDVDVRGKKLDAVLVARHMKNNEPPCAIPVLAE